MHQVLVMDIEPMNIILFAYVFKEQLLRLMNNIRSVLYSLKFLRLIITNKIFMLEHEAHKTTPTKPPTHYVHTVLWYRL